VAGRGAGAGLSAPASPPAGPCARRAARPVVPRCALRRNVTLAELSAFAGVSPYHLARVFRAARGIPPHRYLEQRRVREAQALILAGHALPFVAAEAGFNDQSQLARHFKRHLGVTPGPYRRALFPGRSPRRG
jgi:AraC-like DNA-binding protein